MKNFDKIFKDKRLPSFSKLILLYLNTHKTINRDDIVVDLLQGSANGEQRKSGEVCINLLLREKMIFYNPDKNTLSTNSNSYKKRKSKPKDPTFEQRVLTFNQKWVAKKSQKCHAIAKAISKPFLDDLVKLKMAPNKGLRQQWRANSQYACKSLVYEYGEIIVKEALEYFRNDDFWQSKIFSFVDVRRHWHRFEAQKQPQKFQNAGEERKTNLIEEIITNE